jgi:hypothetical protein
METVPQFASRMQEHFGNCRRRRSLSHAFLTPPAPCQFMSAVRVAVTGFSIDFAGIIFDKVRVANPGRAYRSLDLRTCGDKMFAAERTTQLGRNCIPVSC